MVFVAPPASSASSDDAAIGTLSVVPPPDGLETTVTSSCVESCESLPVNRSTYVPGSENVAVVTGEVASPKATVPGPLSLVHCDVRLGGVGLPSSVTEPFSDTASGNCTL